MKFKFLQGERTQYILINTRDTNETFSIPLDMYGQIMQLAVDLHVMNMVQFSDIDYIVDNGMDDGILYRYRINFIASNTMNPDRIKINYSVEFPDNRDYYQQFTTTERISLYRIEPNAD